MIKELVTVWLCCLSSDEFAIGMMHVGADFLSVNCVSSNNAPMGN